MVLILDTTMPEEKPGRRGFVNMRSGLHRLTSDRVMAADQIEWLPEEMRIVRLLRTLNEDPNWCALFRNKSRRLSEMEMIWRFFRFTLSGIMASARKDFLAVTWHMYRLSRERGGSGRDRLPIL
jgi:hypothetical protein